jgi:hypothetical protein
MKRQSVNVTTQGMKVIDTVQAHCPDCNGKAEVYVTGLFRCISKPCIRDSRCKVFAPTRRREPVLYALRQEYLGLRHAGKRNGRKKLLERVPPLKPGRRCASAGAPA